MLFLCFKASTHFLLAGLFSFGSFLIVMLLGQLQCFNFCDSGTNRAFNTNCCFKTELLCSFLVSLLFILIKDITIWTVCCFLCSTIIIIIIIIIKIIIIYVLEQFNRFLEFVWHKVVNIKFLNQDSASVWGGLLYLDSLYL